MRPKSFAICAVLLVCAALLWVLLNRDGDRSSRNVPGVAGAQTISGSPRESARLLAAPSGDETSPARGVRKFTYEIPVPANDTEFVAAMRTAMAESNEHRKHKALLDLMEYLTPQNAKAVRGIFREFDKIGVLQIFAWRAFWLRWGEIDGAGAMRYYADHPDDGGQQSSFNSILTGWTATDPAAAREWLFANRESPTFGEALSGYATEAARADLTKATRDVFASSQDGGVVFGAVSALADAAKRSGVGGVRNWFDTLSPQEKAIAFEHALWRINDAPVEEAAEWFRQQAGAPWRNDKHLSLLAQKYVEKDPAEALAWLTALPPSQTGERAGFLPALEAWTRLDGAAAGKWLDGRESEPWFPAAAAGHFVGLSRQNNQTAQAFLQQFDQASRQRIMEAVRQRR